MAHVARSHRQRGDIQSHAEEAVKAANFKASKKVGKWDEGLTVDEGLHCLSLNSSGEDDGKGENGKDDNDVDPFSKGGYDVKDYDFGNYDTNEYDVAEYKSVYDD